MPAQTRVRRRRGRLEVARRIDASPDSAWTVLTDTERWPDWGPSVRAVESDDRIIAAGTRGRIRTPVGVWVPFEITTCDPDARRWTWTVARVPATGHRVDPAGDRCRVVFELPLLGAPYIPVCRRALDRIATLLEGHSSAGSGSATSS